MAGAGVCEALRGSENDCEEPTCFRLWLAHDVSGFPNGRWLVWHTRTGFRFGRLFRSVCYEIDFVLESISKMSRYIIDVLHRYRLHLPLLRPLLQHH